MREERRVHGNRMLINCLTDTNCEQRVLELEETKGETKH